MQLRYKRNQLFIELMQYRAPIFIRIWALCIDYCNLQPIGQQVIGEVAQGYLGEYFVGGFSWLWGCFYWGMGRRWYKII